MAKVLAFCEACGIPITPGAKREIRYHIACAQKSLPPVNSDMPQKEICYEHCAVCETGKALFEIDGCKVCAACYRDEQFCQVCGREILSTEKVRYDEERKANHPACLLEEISVELALSEINRCGGKLGILFEESNEQVLGKTSIRNFIQELSRRGWSRELSTPKRK